MSVHASQIQADGSVVSDDVIVYQNASASFTWAVTDAAGAAVSLTGKALRFTASRLCLLDAPEVIHDTADIGGVTIGTTPNTNQVTVTLATDDTGVLGQMYFAIWNTTDNTPVANGGLHVVAISQVVP